MCGLGKNWMPPFFRHPAIPPHPASAEGEDSREYVELSSATLDVKSQTSREDAILESRPSIPRNWVSREDDNSISTFHPQKPGFLTDVPKIWVGWQSVVANVTI